MQVKDGRFDMRLSYNKLWHLLLDKKMSKKALAELAGVSGSTLTKLSRDETVNTEVIEKICTVLGCDLNDIVQLVPDEQCERDKNLE
jgi:DNA-binding Xre family transcriptional regulator